MRRLLSLVAAVMMVASGAWAQQVQVVDADGQGIPLASVLNDDGVIIGIRLFRFLGFFYLVDTSVRTYCPRITP